jgi:hypothetical protein
MNAHAVSYPSLRRRVIVERRSRALFFGASTQHVSRSALCREIGRAAIGLVGIAAWAAALTLLAT